jgi:hypothetical protein
MSKNMHCLNCGKAIVSTGWGFDYVHKDTALAACERVLVATPRLDFS